MTIVSAIRMFLIVIVATMCFVFILGRLQAIISAMRLNSYYRRETSQTKRSQRANELFHDRRLEEIGKDSGQLALSLLVALAVLVFLWFISAGQDLAAYRQLMIVFHITSGAAFMISLLSRGIALSVIPSDTENYGKIKDAVRKGGFTLTLMFLLYTIGCWLYSL